MLGDKVIDWGDRFFDWIMGINPLWFRALVFMVILTVLPFIVMLGLVVFSSVFGTTGILVMVGVILYLVAYGCVS